MTTPLSSPPESTSSPIRPGLVKNRQRAPLAELWDGLSALPKQFFREFLYRANHLPLINYELGRSLLSEGRARDASMRLRFSVWLAPKHQPSWYSLGAAYLSLGQREKAIAAFAQAYKLNPSHEETRFMLAAIDPAILPEAKRPLTMPASIAIDYFERLAPDYDRMQAARGYRMPAVTEVALREVLEPKRTNYQLLDLGCGTGLLGAVLAPYCSRITGVDFSRGMLGLSRERRREDLTRIYTDLHESDVRLYLADVKEPVHLITAVGVLSYLGELGTLCEYAARALQPGGVFLFDTEPYAGEGCSMLPKLSRFGHSEAYIRQKLVTAGLEIVKSVEVPADATSTHRLYLARRPA
jgi:predicted TPR repeat methyltransferase